MTTLVAKVRKKRRQIDSALRSKPSSSAVRPLRRRSPASVLSKEAVAAIALAEQFDFIKPDEYILPLDAMAGFCTSSINATDASEKAES